MTSRRPPPGRPPDFESYRPSEERPPPRAPSRPGPYQDYAQSYPDPAPPYPPQQQRYAHQGMAPPRDGYGYGPPPGAPPPTRKSGIGLFVIYGLLGLVAMVAGAVAFAIVALPANFVRDRVVAAVKQKTGRDLAIGGTTSFTFYPSVGVSLADVSLSGAPGFESGKPLVAMKSLDVSVALWPLLKREVKVSTLVMRDPVFHLEVSSDGRRSWDFAAADAAASRVRFAQADIGTGSDAALPGAPSRRALKLGDLRLEDVRIDNGALTYHDQRTGNTSEVSALNAKVTLAALTEPLLAQGSVNWKGQTVSFDGAMTTLSDAIENRPAKLKLKLGAPAVDATFDGSTRFDDGVFAEGILSAKTASARGLARWFGSELPPSQGFGPLTAKGVLRGSADKLSFSTAEIVLDATTARGDISLDTTRARPFVTANLKLTALDLNTYASTGGGESTPSRAAPQQPSASGRKAQSIDDLLQQQAPPGPRVKGYTKRDGWDEEPFNLTLLGLLDANAKLSIDKLTVGKIRLDKSDLSVALKNRVMTTTLDQVRLYEGTGRGTVAIDGTADAAAVNANLSFDGVSALPLLKDAADLDKLAGKGRLALALAGKGQNQRQIVETLNGKVDFAFADGAIIGVNIPGMVRSLSKGNLGGLTTQPSDKTDFSELSSTWAVKSGIAENQDLKLVSPLLRVGGSGRIALPAREIDYMLRPKVVASLDGQGGAQELSGLEIPVRVHGSLDNPKFTPDLSGAFKDPNKAVETIKDLGKQFKGKKADEIVNDLLGGGSGNGASGESAKSKGKKLLDQFLNQQ